MLSLTDNQQLSAWLGIFGNPGNPVLGRKDIRTLGNHNANAANVGRSVGILSEALVVIVEFAKGAISVRAARGLNLNEACALTGAAVARPAGSVWTRL